MTKPYHPIQLGAPGEEISIKDLYAIKLRFKKLHQMRLQSVHDFLQPRQQIFLDLLPLIFHGNYPLLPGFISSSTPAGLFEYSPGGRTLQAARKFIQNFKYNAHSASTWHIDGLFLMGSVGSIAFSKASDMDIWLCYHSDLCPQEIGELENKAQAVENWAATLDLEVHFFLMNSKLFRQGLDVPMSKESCGETQHYLLLEEFYRTSIYIAGKSLAWWLVPPEQEHNYGGYLKHLVDQRFIDENRLIDFGGLNAVPAEEFISATLWHIYKSLQSPHKSLLKLLLMESYASEYPNPQWLSLEIKQAIYQGHFTSTDLDPYLLIYQKVETYLNNSHSLERLGLARQNFFLKVIDSSDDAMSFQALASREKYLLTIADRCHWQIKTLEELKRHRVWDIKTAISEHDIILRQLAHCFRVIMGFASEHVNQSYRHSYELELIGRKLYSFLEKKTGKIEIITTRTAVHSREQELSIVEGRSADDKQSWTLFFNNVQNDSISDVDPILKCRTLIEILGWLVINGFYQPEQQIYVRSKLLNLSHEELQRILGQLDLFFKNNFNWEASLVNYQSVNALIKSHVIVNIGDAMPDGPDTGLCLISERSDVLSYGMDRRCLIQTVDRISISSWSEIVSSHHEGIEGFFDCLIGIINHHKKPLSNDDLSIVCYTPVRAKSIIQRIENVFGALVNLFSEPQQDSQSRYILSGGEAYYLFQRIDKDLAYTALTSNEQVLAELARPQEHYCSVYFDEKAMTQSPVPLIYTLNRPKTVQFFYFENCPVTTIYIIDERGTLYSREYTQSNCDQLLSHYSIFLLSIVKRMTKETIVDIEYYEIQKDSSDILTCQQIILKAPGTSKMLNLRICSIADENGPGYSIYCNEHVFSSLEYGNQVFHAAHQHILRCRQSKLDYPIYITDIDLPLSAFALARPDQLQTVHYLNIKQKIEVRLNNLSK